MARKKYQYALLKIGENDIFISYLTIELKKSVCYTVIKIKQCFFVAIVSY